MKNAIHKNISKFKIQLQSYLIRQLLRESQVSAQIRLPLCIIMTSQGQLRYTNRIKNTFYPNREGSTSWSSNYTTRMKKDEKLMESIRYPNFINLRFGLRAARNFRIYFTSTVLVGKVMGDKKDNHWKRLERTAPSQIFKINSATFVRILCVRIVSTSPGLPRKILKGKN